MNANCVNIHSSEFLKLSRDLDIHPGQLEMIIHEYINREGNTSDEFPSAEYIKNKLNGDTKNIVSNYTSIEVWKRHFSDPKSFNTYEEASEYKEFASKFFTPDSIIIRQTSRSAAYDVVIKIPTLDTEYVESAKEKAINDLKNSINAPEAVSKVCAEFLQNFGISINDLKNYSGEVPLFDIIERLINAKTADDITEGTGYAVAFMMQWTPEMIELISMLERASSSPLNAKGLRRQLSRTTGEIELSYRVSDFRKKVPGGDVRNQYLQEIGKLISDELKRFYNLETSLPEENKGFFKQLWNIITAFFKRLNPISRASIDRINSYPKVIAASIIKNDKSIILRSDIKPGSGGERSSLLSLENAFKENPYEESIIKLLSDHNIGLAGSAAIRAQGTIYRPAENPLHDIDFSAPDLHSKEEVQTLLNKLFPNNQYIRTILGENGNCETFLILDRPFIIEEEQKMHISVLKDPTTKEVLGSFVNSDLTILKDGVKGKFLDFFTNTTEQLNSIKVNDKEYLFADSRGAFKFKVNVAREKDIWDYARFVPNEHFRENKELDTRFNLQNSSETIADTVINLLRKQGLVNNLYGKTYLSMHQRIGETKREAVNRSLKDLNTYVTRQLGLPYGVIEQRVTDSKRGVAISINKNLINQYKDAVQAGATIQDAQTILAISDFLGDTFGVKFGGIISQTKAKEMTGLDANAFIRDNKVYVVANKVTTDTVAEEYLHPFVNAIFKEEPELFKSLFEKADKLFPELKLRILDNYSGKQNYKFTATDLQQELIAQALGRKFRQEWENTISQGNTITTEQTLKQIQEAKGWWEKAYKAIKDLLTTLADKMFGNKVRFAAEDLRNFSLDDIIKLISASDSQFWISHNDKIRFNLNEEESIEQSDTKPEETEKSKLEKIALESQRLVKQYNDLNSTTLFSSSEIRQTAEQLVYFLGSKLSEYIDNPEYLVEDAEDIGISLGKDITNKIKGKTRREVVNAIGAENLITIIRQLLFNSEFNPNITSEDNSIKENEIAEQKAKLLSDNLGFLLELAKDTFINTEGFAITFDDYANMQATERGNEGDQTFGDSESEADIVDRGESLQEKWQIEFRTQDAMHEMSQVVRKAINDCFELDEDGDPILDMFGIPKRRNPRESTQAILRITQGSLTLADMISKMKSKVSDNPWMQQLIDRLEVEDGSESDFKSQFYGVFQKPFQAYNIVRYNEKKGAYESIQVNKNPARKDAMDSIKSQYRIGEHPIYSLDGVNIENFNLLKQYNDELKSLSYNEDNRDKFIELATGITRLLGFYVSDEIINNAINEASIKSIINSLHYIVNTTQNAIDNETSAWDPFEYGKTSIGGNLSTLISPFTDLLEDSTASSFYESGKMYQSYVIPSYMTLLLNKFKQTGDDWINFLRDEYGNSEWYRDTSVFDIEDESAWKSPWLGLMASSAKYKDMFDHKVELAFDKSNYMKTMDDNQYTLSLITEYLSNDVSSTSQLTTAWYRIPMLSNKPSSEFIKFVRYTGTNYQSTMLPQFMKIFSQELSRIQTVEKRKAVGINKSSSRYIKNFDDNGNKFNFLQFLNKYLEGGTQAKSEIGQLLNNKIKNGKIDNEAKLNSLIYTEIQNALNNQAAATIEDWKNKGILDTAVKKISGLSEDNINDVMTEFIWNDALASMNIMEILVTDPAFYKNVEDLQKRFAQIHAPGIRGDKYATYDGKRVSDGTFRAITLKDFSGEIVKANILENLRIVFDRKLDQYRKAYPEDEAGYKAREDYYNSIISDYNTEINAADAQAFTSPTAYRKKAIIFGKWTPEKEALYQKIKKGDYKFDDLKTVFGQPLKPFVYGKTQKNIGIPDSPIQNIPMPVQFKNSEYLLLMADAILRGEETGQPNLLRVIYDVMEESADLFDGKGIDTIQFESAVKSGLCGKIDLTSFLNTEFGELKARDALKNAIYTTNEKGAPVDYNKDSVQELDFDYFCIQQEVPPHFKEHEQSHGSQLRYMIISDLESQDYQGNPVTYDFYDNGEFKQLDKNQFRTEYEKNISENIDESLEELKAELGLDTPDIRTRNILLSKILQKEILSSPRYGIDLLIACSVDEDGNFNIPLGDPIQSKRIEQLINSIIKNRFNKQEILGGPVVQVTNLGTSKRLNIVFKDKEGNLLSREDHPEMNDSEWNNFLKENQYGVAYYECYAPITSNKLFQRFVDKDGNIDIEAIKKKNPELLEMIGYRIPTEDKYSAAPLRIVGFLPRESGDGIMLPYEITLITGSDFDVRLY